MLLAGMMIMFGLTAGSALALPSLPTGYSWTNAPFWQNTDLTTANSNFVITLENASYESDFGLFTVDDVNNPTAIVNTLQVFSYTDEVGDSASVNFKYEGGIYKAQLDGAGDWIEFDSNFGFYYAVHTGGAVDPIADYTYYTFNAFNEPFSESGSLNTLKVATQLMIFVR